MYLVSLPLQHRNLAVVIFRLPSPRSLSWNADTGKLQGSGPNHHHTYKTCLCTIALQRRKTFDVRPTRRLHPLSPIGFSHVRTNLIADLLGQQINLKLVECKPQHFESSAQSFDRRKMVGIICKICLQERIEDGYSTRSDVVK